MGSLRTVLIVILAVCVGLAGGYLWESQKVKEKEGQIKSLMARMEDSSRASQEQLAKATSDKEVLKLRLLVAEARSDVVERNFGRAEERISAIESSLDQAFAPLGDQAIAARDNIRMGLEGIKEGLKKLDVKVKLKIEELAKIMDQTTTK